MDNLLTTNDGYLAILDFWFSLRLKDHWFSSTPEIDGEIRNRFEPAWKQAADGRLLHWRKSPNGALALVILLDQFPLNIYRGQARSFSTESHAIEITKFAIEEGYDRNMPKERVAFLYMPLMHSEKLENQDLSVRLFRSAGLQNSIRFAEHHRELIRKFGRFPHRNAILGRKSTDDERLYLHSADAFMG